MDLTVIIPARNEKYLQRTIESVLENIEADTEIIAVCDGYWPEPPINDHERVVLIHHTDARGQRQSINEAARIARGKYIMKLDAHCAVAPGFDRVLIESHQPGWTQVPRMYNLNVETWEPKKHKRTDYMYIGFNERGEMRAQYYTGSDYRRWHKRTEEIDGTMCCMGPGWFLSLEDFWKQGGCDETHGSWGQQGIEVSLKAWLSGGALMVNKKTWFSHWFRGNEGFPYPISGNAISKARSYSKKLWMGNQWEGQTKTIEWLVKKFNPPGWEHIYMDDRVKQANGLMYQHLHRRQHHPKWKGINILKMPTDLFLYHQTIWETKPKWIVETGTKFGGSALFFQDMLDQVGEGGRVITIDKDLSQVEEFDPRIIYLDGSSRDKKIVKQVKEMVNGEPCMVVLDSDHGRVHVKWELEYYAPLVTPGCYCVIEDCYIRDLKPYYPLEARDWFLSDTKTGRKFVNSHLGTEFLVGVCVGGWLRRKNG